MPHTIDLTEAQLDEMEKRFGVCYDPDIIDELAPLFRAARAGLRLLGEPKPKGYEVTDE